MSDGQPPAFPAPEIPGSTTGPAPALGQELLYPAFMAGICAGVLSGVPLINACCCLWMVGGGMLAVYFFLLKHGRPLTNPRDGARLGLLTGFFGFFVGFFVNVFSQILIHRGVQAFIVRYREALEKSAAKADPQAKEALAWATSPGGMATLFIVTTVIFFLLFIVLSTAGGILGVRAQRARR